LNRERSQLNGEVLERRRASTSRETKREAPVRFSIGREKRGVMRRFKTSSGKFQIESQEKSVEKRKEKKPSGGREPSGGKTGRERKAQSVRFLVGKKLISRQLWWCEQKTGER